MKQKKNSKKVLVIEDQNLLALVTQKLISLLGYESVGIAGSGREAIEMFKAEKPDIIVMDIFLNGDMDGVEAMKQIRKVSNVSVIFTSASSDQATYRKAKKIGFTDYLVKPVMTDDLIRALKNTGFRSESESSEQV